MTDQRFDLLSNYMDYCIDYIVQKHTTPRIVINGTGNINAGEMLYYLESMGVMPWITMEGSEMVQIETIEMLTLEEWEEKSLVEKYAPLQQEKNRLMHEIRNKIQ